MTTISIMQPYFLPYAGYFRLFEKSDIFVLYDCVQFPRRGWVHRNRFTNYKGELSWLTLPLKKSSQDTRISDLQFQENAKEIIKQQMNKFPALCKNHEIITYILDVEDKKPVEYLHNLLQETCRMLNKPFNVVYSSKFNIEAEIKGQNRIIKICKELGAKKYINSPGGRSLYDPELFKNNGITLEFLDEYQGPMQSVAETIINGS